MKHHEEGAGPRGLPPELAELDEELAGLHIQERPSFGPELAAELSREWVRERSRPTASAGRRAVAAVVGSLLLVGMASSPVRASLVRIVEALLPAPVETPPVAESPAPRPSTDLAVPSEEPRPAPPRPAPLWTAEELQPIAPENPPFDPGAWSFPELVDVEADKRLMRRYYPPELLERGIGGRVVLQLWVDSLGAVDGVHLRRSSGTPELDRAALRAAVALRFTPARRRGVAVGTWVEFPLLFVPEAAAPVERASDPSAPGPGALRIPELPDPESSELLPAWSGDAVVTAPMEVEGEAMLRAAIGRPRSEIESRFGPLQGILLGEPPAGASPMAWRREVATTLEEARIRDPDNPAPYLALARIRVRQGLRPEARLLVEEGIGRATRGSRPVSSRLMAELHYERGLLLEEAWRGVSNLGRIPAEALAATGCAHAGQGGDEQGEVAAETLIALSFLCPDLYDRLMGEHFRPALLGNGERTELLRSFQRAVAAFPAHPGANARLLVALAERGRWHEVLSGARRFAWASQGHVHALLLSGIALQRLGRSTEALQDFTTALAGLPAEEAVRLTDPAPLLDRVRARELASLPDDERAARLRAFWASLDPLLLTEVNEREVEHLARAALALFLYGGPETGPGRVLVRYGSPLAIRALSEGKGLRTEFWDYGRGPDISFRRVAGTMDPTPEAAAYLEELRQSFPHQWTDGRPAFPLPAQVARFRTGGGAELEIHTRVPAALATGPRDSLEVGLFVLEGGEARRLKRERLPAAATGLRLNVAVPRGTDRVVVELYHPRLGQGATLGAPPFRGKDDDPRISDLLLVAPASPERAGLVREALGAQPRNGLETSAPGSVGLFFELYDLDADDDRYRLRVELQPEGSDKRFPVRIRPAGQRSFDREWDLELVSGRGTSPEYLTLEVPGVGRGVHTLHLFLEPRGGEVLHQTLPLTVVQGSATAREEGLEIGDPGEP